MMSMFLFSFYVLCFHISWVRGVAIPVKYLGCMIEAGADEQRADHFKKRGSFVTEITFRRLSVQACTYQCYLRRFKMMALQGGYRCYCGSHTRDLKIRGDEFCYEPCTRNCRQRCGGLVTMSVYQTGYQKEPSFEFPIWILREGFIGCFRMRVFPNVCKHQNIKPNLRTPRMTPEMCALYCHAGNQHEQMAVGVMRAREECCCTKSRDARHQPYRVDDHHCFIRCKGDTRKGGFDKTQCMGKVTIDNNMEKTFTAWDIIHMAHKGLPHEPPNIFKAKAGWLEPVYDNQTFELKDGIYQYDLDAGKSPKQVQKRSASRVHNGNISNIPQEDASRKQNVRKILRMSGNNRTMNRNIGKVQESDAIQVLKNRSHTDKVPKRVASNGSVINSEIKRLVLKNFQKREVSDHTLTGKIRDKILTTIVKNEARKESIILTREKQNQIIKRNLSDTHSRNDGNQVAQDNISKKITHQRINNSALKKGMNKNINRINESKRNIIQRYENELPSKITQNKDSLKKSNDSKFQNRHIILQELNRHPRELPKTDPDSNNTENNFRRVQEIVGTMNGLFGIHNITMMIRPPQKVQKRSTADSKKTGKANSNEITDMPELLGKVEVDEDSIEQARPIIEPENTGVKVVDIPETEEEETSVLTTLTLVFACLLSMVGISVVLFKKKHHIQAAARKMRIERGFLHKKEKDKSPEKGEQAATYTTEEEVLTPVEVSAPDSDYSPMVTTTDDETLKPLL